MGVTDERRQQRVKIHDLYFAYMNESFCLIILRATAMINILNLFYPIYIYMRCERYFHFDSMNRLRQDRMKIDLNNSQLTFKQHSNDDGRN